MYILIENNKKNGKKRRRKKRFEWDSNRAPCDRRDYT